VTLIELRRRVALESVQFAPCQVPLLFAGHGVIITFSSNPVFRQDRRASWRVHRLRYQRTSKRIISELFVVARALGYRDGML
jgi:hypothetical protein